MPLIPSLYKNESKKTFNVFSYTEISLSLYFYKYVSIVIQNLGNYDMTINILKYN